MDNESTGKSELKETIDSLSKYFVERLRLPIAIAYFSLLVIYNWDILFYLAYEKQSALEKICYVKYRFSPEYIRRILTPAFLALAGSVIITIIQVGLNFLMSIFKKFDLKRIHLEEKKFAGYKRIVISELTGINEIEQAANKIKQLETERDSLNTNLTDCKGLQEDSSKEIADLKEKINSLERYRAHFANIAKDHIQLLSKLYNECKGIESITFDRSMEKIEGLKDRPFDISDLVKSEEERKIMEQTIKKLVDGGVLTNEILGGETIGFSATKIGQAAISEYNILHKSHLRSHTINS